MKNEVLSKSEQIYDLLLKLYPKGYKQQFAEEMTFVFSESLKDVYARDGSKGIVAYWGRTLIDLFESVISEHLEDKKDQDSMNSNYSTTVISAALSGLLMVLPFVILEWVTTLGFARLGFPLMLFTMMWLFAALFVLILIPIVRTVRAGSISMANPLFLALKLVFMGLLAWAWIGLVIDQMPCFLGIPNCD